MVVRCCIAFVTFSQKWFEHGFDSAVCCLSFCTLHISLIRAGRHHGIQTAVVCNIVAGVLLHKTKWSHIHMYTLYTLLLVYSYMQNSMRRKRNETKWNINRIIRYVIPFRVKPVKAPRMPVDNELLTIEAFNCPDFMYCTNRMPIDSPNKAIAIKRIPPFVNIREIEDKTHELYSGNLVYCHCRVKSVDEHLNRNTANTHFATWWALIYSSEIFLLSCCCTMNSTPLQALCGRRIQLFVLQTKAIEYDTIITISLDNCDAYRISKAQLHHIPALYCID